MRHHKDPTGKKKDPTKALQAGMQDVAKDRRCQKLKIINRK